MSGSGSEVIRLTDSIAHNNRLIEVGRVAGHVAHEAHSKLETASLYLRLLRRRLSDDAGSLDVLTKVEEGLVGIKATLDDLLQYSAQRSPRPERVRVRQIVDEICAEFAGQFSARAVHVDIDVPSGTTVLADRDMLRRGISNLMLNALDAMPDGGELVCTSYDGPGGFELEIADSGPGLCADVKRRAFEPFFSTKPGGTGLGLTIVERIAAAHGGRVSARNCPEGGAAFTICIPPRAMEAAA
jgi:signal transduction histidine kinase